MSRFRTPLIVLGLLGALLVAVATVVVIRVGRGRPEQVPVAVRDIPPGTPLDPADFRVESLRGLDGRTLAAIVTADEFAQYVGLPTLETIHQGFPLGVAQVRTDSPNDRQNRLTLLLEDPDNLVFPLGVTADQAGNFLVPGDRVDVVFSLGRVAAHEMERVEEVEAPQIPGMTGATTPTLEATPETRRVGDLITTTVELPLAKVILRDVHVLRVEREQVRTTSATYGAGAEPAARQTAVEGDVIRLYVELTGEQAEVLSFAVHNGALNLPARAQPAGGVTAGYTWADFVDGFFADREVGDE